MTLRDQVWNATLDMLDERDEFKLSDLEFQESERHTVRRVLRRMEDYGWLDRRTPNSSIWQAGPKYESFIERE